jgi:NADPH:quinone reductase-like Zn-dependent oxidoreductase
MFNAMVESQWAPASAPRLNEIPHGASIMKAYQVLPGGQLDGLNLTLLPERPLGPSDVRVRIRAVSLNYRDLLVARGLYPVAEPAPVIPCSDGAGEVIEVGSEVMRFSLGDRVAASFFPHWIDGDPAPEKVAGALGAAADGVLAEELVFDEQAVAKIPSHLSFAEAAVLPCVAVAAWNALFVAGRLKPGASVLLLGTGGVSVMALQLAKAAGLTAFITSSSDVKLDRAKALGADLMINYTQTSEWQDEVLDRTHGQGVDLVVEVGGEQTLARSLAAARMGGAVAVVGGVSGFGGSGFSPGAMIFGAKRLEGIFVGSRVMLEDVGRFVEATKLKPVIDRTFSFDDAKGAYRFLESGAHFGKVVVEI